MKKKDFTTKSTKELQALVLEKKTALRNFRFAVAGSKTRNVKEGNALKKDIARIETILNATK
jgi:ribosomal protein L29